MFNFDGYFDGHSEDDLTFKQTYSFNQFLQSESFFLVLGIVHIYLDEQIHLGSNYTEMCYMKRHNSTP